MAHLSLQSIFVSRTKQLGSVWGKYLQALDGVLQLQVLGDLLIDLVPLLQNLPVKQQQTVYHPVCRRTTDSTELSTGPCYRNILQKLKIKNSPG